MRRISEALIDRIYEAAVVVDEWPVVLQSIADECGSGGGTLITSASGQYMNWHLSTHLGSSAAEYLGSDAPRRSQTLPRLLAADWAGFLTDQDLYPEEEQYRNDVFVADWAQINGFYHSAGTAIQVPNGDLSIVQFVRRSGEAPFSPEDINLLNLLRPHLARASVLTSRWRREHLKTMTQALEILGLPAAVFDAAGRVQAANSLIEALPDHIIWRSQDRLSLVDSQAAALLDATLRRGVTGFSAISSFAAHGADGGGPVVLHALPIGGQARELFNKGLTLIVVTRPDHGRIPDSLLIQGLFDLTPGEARVATGLIVGLSIRELALQSGVGQETVRTQVQAILGKTGSRRQAEFVAKFRSVELPG